MVPQLIRGTVPGFGEQYLIFGNSRALYCHLGVRYPIWEHSLWAPSPHLWVQLLPFVSTCVPHLWTPWQCGPFVVTVPNLCTMPPFCGHHAPFVHNAPYVGTVPHLWICHICRHHAHLWAPICGHHSSIAHLWALCPIWA